MNETELEAYKEWCAACDRFVRHLDAAGLLGGHCEAEDPQGRLWDFTFQPLEVENG